MNGTSGEFRTENQFERSSILKILQ
ncbi:hypothetical protein TNCT_394361, partial [Trichonephila clavata]